MWDWGGQALNSYWKMDKYMSDCWLVGMPCITLAGRGIQINLDMKEVRISKTQLWLSEMLFYIEFVGIQWENMCRVKLDCWKPRLLFYHSWENNFNEIQGKPLVVDTTILLTFSPCQISHTMSLYNEACKALNWISTGKKGIVNTLSHVTIACIFANDV